MISRDSKYFLLLNVGHFLDHFVMLIFAKAAYDAGREFDLSYEEIIAYGAFGFVLFGGRSHPIGNIFFRRQSRGGSLARLSCHGASVALKVYENL